MVHISLTSFIQSTDLIPLNCNALAKVATTLLGRCLIGSQPANDSQISGQASTSTPPFIIARFVRNNGRCIPPSLNLGVGTSLDAKKNGWFPPQSFIYCRYGIQPPGPATIWIFEGLLHDCSVATTDMMEGAIGEGKGQYCGGFSGFVVIFLAWMEVKGVVILGYSADKILHPNSSF